MKMKLILNEKKYIEEIIESSIMPDTISPNAMITCLTKYYYNKDITLDELNELVCFQMNKFNLDITQYQDYKAKIRIKKVYNELVNDKTFLLKEYEYLPLYKSEYDKIMTCEDDREKKILFTLYILARYTNCYGWVYYAENDIYKLANVSSTVKNKQDIIARLIKKELVKDTKKVDDLKIGVDLSSGDEEIVLKVTELSSLGNQFMVLIKPGYKLCECCNKLIKIKGKNTRYCSVCAKNKELEIQRECMKILRETQKRECF